MHLDRNGMFMSKKMNKFVKNHFNLFHLYKFDFKTSKLL